MRVGTRYPYSRFLTGPYSQAVLKKYRCTMLFPTRPLFIVVCKFVITGCVHGCLPTLPVNTARNGKKEHGPKLVKRRPYSRAVNTDSVGLYTDPLKASCQGTQYHKHDCSR